MIILAFFILLLILLVILLFLKISFMLKLTFDECGFNMEVKVMFYRLLTL